MTSYPSQAGGRNSVCGGAEAGGNQGGEGTGWCCEQKPGQRVSGAAVTAPGSRLCHIAAQWIEGESRRGCAGQFSSVQSLSHDQLFATPWTAALQASLSITSSRSLRKLMSIESVMPSNHFILCRPLLLLPSIFPSIWVFSNESALRIRWPKYWSFSFNISPSSEHSGLVSFRMDWLDLLAVQGTLKSFLRHHSSKASILLVHFRERLWQLWAGWEGKQEIQLRVNAGVC